MTTGWVMAAALLATALVAGCSGSAAPVSVGTPPPASAAATTTRPTTAVEPVNVWALDGAGEATIGGADLAFFGTFEQAQKAIAFDGVTGFGSTAGSGPLITTSSFSVAAWVNLARPAEFATAVSQLGDVAGAFYLGVGEGSWDFAMKTADTNEPGHTVRASSGPARPDPTAWVHLVGVYDQPAGRIRLYVDGQLASAASFSEAWQADGILTVGRSQAHAAPSDFWPGAIADVRLFSTALDDEQVSSEYDDDRPATPPPPSLATPVTCPSPHGGVCLGPLEAGTYTTRAFKTPLTYTVPDGWANFEDLPGNFLLVPPGGSNDGVDAGTSDYIGVYHGVAPVSGECEERPEASVARTPEAIGAWYANHPGLVVSERAAVTIGGLEGVALDLAMTDGDAGVCDIPELGEFVPILVGVGPAALTHVLNDSFTMRLYLLGAPTGEVIAIEIDDLPGGATMDQMIQVAEGMQFETDGP